MFAAIWGYIVLKPTGWLCWEIGGEKSITEVFRTSMSEVPYLKLPRPVLIYALGTMGYHFGDSVNQVLFKERTSDHYEMLLHHIATVALYFCMIFGNNSGIGCVIAYLHDIGDIFGCTVKCCSTTRASNLTLGVFIVMMSVWFWTRLFVLPQMIWLAMTEPFPDSFVIFIRINGIFLCVL